MKTPPIIMVFATLLAPASSSIAGTAASAKTPIPAVEQKTTATLAPGASGPAVIRAQVLLACVRYSPGEIDGRFGDDLTTATKGYQEDHGLKPTGIINAATWKLLDRHAGPILVPYTITAADIKGPFEPIPKSVAEQAKLKWMGYESPEELLGERFHMSPKLLAQLNPGKKFDTAGERITVVNVRLAPARRATRVVVSKTKRTVTAFGPGKTVLGRYPATIGGAHDPLPLGNWKIVGISRNPWFHWDPVHFWNVDAERAPEKLPPGPNNPAGSVWLGLSKPTTASTAPPTPATCTTASPMAAFA